MSHRDVRARRRKSTGPGAAQQALGEDDERDSVPVPNLLIDGPKPVGLSTDGRPRAMRLEKRQRCSQALTPDLLRRGDRELYGF